MSHRNTFLLAGLIGIALFTGSTRGRSCPSQQGCVERIDAHGQTIKLYFKLQGCGKQTIVFVHGVPYNSNIWECQVREFCKKYQVLTLDLRGFSRSTPITPPNCNITCADFAEDVHFVITSLGIKKPIFVGHSLGATVGILYATMFPDELCKLALINGTPLSLSSDTQQFGLTLGFVNTIVPLLTAQDQNCFNQFADLWNSQAFTEPCDLTQLKNTVRDIILDNNPCSLAAGFIFSGCAASFIPLLSQIKVPTLITAGGLDQLVPPGAGFFMRTMIPNSRLFVFGCSGHLPFLTHTPLFNKVLHNFIRGHQKDDCSFDCKCCPCTLINANIDHPCVPPSSCVQDKSSCVPVLHPPC